MTDPDIASFEAMLEEDISTNKKIGDYGAAEILSKVGKSSVRVLTHCNTGSLATAGYGTALGVIRSLHFQKSLDHAYCTETRPYNQGTFDPRPFTNSAFRIATNRL